jgi:hypothetical protein
MCYRIVSMKPILDYLQKMETKTDDGATASVAKPKLFVPAPTPVLIKFRRDGTSLGPNKALKIYIVTFFIEK